MKSPHPSPHFFARNLEPKGRLLRGSAAALFAFAAVASWSRSPTLGGVLALTSAFLAYEATRGWCALRACGVKTKF